MGSEHEVLERLTALEINTKHILDRFDDLARVSDGFVRLQEANNKQKEQIDILFEKSRRCEGTSVELNKWVNRGVGAYFVGAVLAGIISFFIMRMIDQYEATMRMHNELITTLDRRMAWVEFEMRKEKDKR